MELIILGAVIAVGVVLFLAQGTLYNRQESANEKLDAIIQKENAIMATQQEFTDALARVQAEVDEGNTSLGKIEADIADLKAQINAGGMTAADETAALAQIADLEAKVAAQSDRLAAIDDTTPGTPPAEPPVEPPVP